LPDTREYPMHHLICFYIKTDQVTPSTRPLIPESLRISRFMSGQVLE
jgi:hypothetical protein